MRVVQINTTCGIGSTGKICLGISRLLTADGIENHVICSTTNSTDYSIAVSSRRYARLQALKSRIFGNYGFNSVAATKRMIRELDRIDPDVVHLHNIHGHDCDLELLFTYFRERGTRLVWTFHDCWAFTGYCTYFDLIGCDKWKNGCHNCPRSKEFSWFFDRSAEMYERKKRLFTDLDLTVVTPSGWLADLVKQSFLSDAEVVVINNGINLDVFKPRDGVFRKKYGLEDKKIILGVSFEWEKRKGLDVFVHLASVLPEDYRIVLVGTDNNTDKALPPNILSIHRTQNQQELAEIYSAADLFVNPTREENYPTVNMESLACGTPVLTFRTGGSPEIVDESCGSVVDCDDTEALVREIIRICRDKPYTAQACVEKAQSFDQNERFKEYIDLYESAITGRDQRD